MKEVKELVAYLKEKGFIYPGSSIYGGLANSWDYGPLGTILKDKIKKLWQETFIKQDVNDIYYFDSSIMLNPDVWVSSGHVGKFNDPMVDCKECKTRFRADHLIEEHTNLNPATMSFEDMSVAINENIDKCPHCGAAANFTDVRAFDLMFRTSNSKTGEDDKDIYLRPETAQGVFINFKNVVDTMGAKVPFGIGQVGKAFRNEVTPGNFIFRTKEFEQLELEFFTSPDEWEKWFDYYLEKIEMFLEKLGLDMSKVSRLEVPEEDRAHYSQRTVDFEFDYPFGKGELLGLAYRGDYDLKNHDLDYRDPVSNEKYIPHVVEASMGVERLLFALIVSTLKDEELEEGDVREVLQVPQRMAPYCLAIAPLTNKLDEEATKLYRELKVKSKCNIVYAKSGSIGKRYRKQDNIGTPWVATVDFDSLEDGKVTIRNRDTMEQERVPYDEIMTYICPKNK